MHLQKLTNMLLSSIKPLTTNVTPTLSFNSNETSTTFGAFYLIHYIIKGLFIYLFCNLKSSQLYNAFCMLLVWLENH